MMPYDELFSSTYGHCFVLMTSMELLMKSMELFVRFSLIFWYMNDR